MAVTNVQIIDNGQNGSQGDGDGLAEPGEIVGLLITLENLTGANVSDIGAIFDADDPMVQNTGGVALFGELFPAGEVRQATSLALIQIEDDAQSNWIVDGVIGIGVVPTPGADPVVTEEDVFTFRINAPEYVYVAHTPSGTIVPGATVDISFDVANIGLSPGIAGLAQLVSDDMYLTVNSGPQVIPAAATGATVTTSNHTISAHAESFKGYPAKAYLVVSNAEGFLDSVMVTIPLGVRTVTDPVGPDDYGYIAFEDRDSDYDIAPVYDWVEINPDVAGNDFDGTELDIHDSGEEDDDADVVDLPFTMRYYGANFEQMTVTCNGFVSMGNQSDMRTPRNWPIPSPLGPNYMIAPYWDDRKVSGANSGVFSYYDEPNGRFIIEWYSVADDNNAASNTFQLIVYDQVGEHITISGNANILFQYEDVTHTTGHYTDNDYMTVGVENGDQTVGLQLAYWDSDDGPNGTITDGRAILITTQAALITGTVSGTVTLATGGDAVEGALVSTGDNSYFDYTNAQGQYSIEEVVIGEHDLVVSMQGINSQTVTIEVIENQVTTQDFSVTAPDWETSVDEVIEALPQDDVIVSTVTLSNPGDGELEWSVEIDNDGPDGQSTDGWFDLNDEFELTGGDNRNSGLTFHKGYFWVSGANNFQNPNYLYRVNMDGTIVESYEQPVPNPSANGFACLTTDGDYLYGVDDGKLFEMEYDEDTGALSLVSQIVLSQEFEYVGYITYDKDSDLFWIGEHYTPLYAISRDGTIVHEYDLDIPFQGMSYYSEDADGYNLYGVMQETPYVDITVIKINPDNGDTLFVTNIEANVFAVTDVHITYLWDPFFWSFILVKNGSMLNDRVEVYELEPNIAWLNLSSPGGLIQPGGDFPLDVNIASLDLPEGEYSSWLQFTTNTYEPVIYMPVTLTIDNDLDVEGGDGKEAQPLDWVFEGVYPNPFNPTATVSFTMKHTANAKATLYNVLGQQVAVIVDEVLTAGHHQLLLNGDHLASGVYFLRFQAGPMSETRKVVLMR
ncbi:hypothetical protein BMS3Bbin04_01006 [bacterium BMS3Bbin04]|nr:hypothetical protein BMS3Bbin04_01006 [bacterium BMS3Bbin04]